MPELPEVETIVSGLKRKISGQKILAVDVNFTKSLHEIDADRFCDTVVGQRINNVSRRGKFIIFHLSDEYFLLLHLRMTGKVLIKSRVTPATKHDHVVIYLENESALFYNDTRKFGRFFLTKNPQEIIGKLGPEPLSENFIFSEFSQKLASSQRKIKALLLDQHFIAGLGNIYTDEALFEAGIHPEQPGNTISEKKKKHLFFAIQKVLKKGIENQGTSLGDGQSNYSSSENHRGKNQHALKVFARTGQPCFVCATPIKKMVVAQRGTHYCPHCQKM